MSTTARLPPHRPPPAPAAVAALAAALLLAGCAGFAPGRVAPGQDESAVVAAYGAPTARYPLADGGRRLEYAQGPMGRQTWMVTLDAAGRVARVEQVLDSDHFAQVTDGMAEADLLRLLGTPGWRQGEYQHRETLTWRFENWHCLWAQVTLDAARHVMGGVAQTIDPHCKPPTPTRDGG